MSKERRKLGAKGEQLALEFLKKEGYKIQEQNYRCSLGEIDLIAKDKETIVFVEVKTRKSIQYGAPEMAVNAFKKKQITRVALNYLLRKGEKNVDSRFDVVSVFLGDKSHIELIKNAFPLKGRWMY